MSIRATTEDDLPDLGRLWNDGRVMRWVGFSDGLGYDDEALRTWFERLQSSADAHHFVVRDPDVGFCGELFYKVDRAHRRAELDVKLVPEAQERGIATAAFSWLIECLFEGPVRRTGNGGAPNPVSSIAILDHRLRPGAGSVHGVQPRGAGIVRRAGTRARWSLVLASSIALVAIAGASAAGPGGWDHLGEFKTPNAPPLNGAVYALSAESDNGLLVGGAFNFTTADGRPAAHLAVWYPTQFWTAFATPSPLNGDVHAIAWDSDHVRLFVGGTFTNAGGNPNADFLAVWDGTNWAPFCSPAPAFSASVAALQIIGATLYVGGSFANGAGIPSADFLLACDLNTGAARSTSVHDGDINGGVYALTRDANGTLYAGGQFINMAGIPAADHVASYDGTWHALGSGPSPGSGAVDNYVRSLASNGTDVYIGTDSVNVAGIPQADHVAKWNGSAWSALGANSAGTDGWLPASAFIYAIAATSSQVVVTGSFQDAGGNPLADNIASFDGTAWKPLGSNGAGNGPWIGNGLAVAIVGKDIYVGGNFTAAGGDPLATYIARYAPQAAPSNLFTIGAVKADLSKGTARLTVNAPGAGTLTLSGAGVRPVKVTTPSSPAKVTLTVQATDKAKQTLARLGRVNVKVTTTFTPTGGSAKSRSTTVVLKKRK